MATTAIAPANGSTFPGLAAVPSGDPSLAKDPKTMVPRNVKQVIFAQEQAEGAGARVRRSIGTHAIRNFSPFLMLDHFRASKDAGFPDHPHRGQETITLVLKGKVDHEDFAGNKGTLGPGDLQFMTAGAGVVHSEMPRYERDEHGEYIPVEGMQLWVDLPENLKMCEPRYRDLRGTEIPKVSVDDGKVDVKIISGMVEGHESVKELAYTPVWLLDITLKAGGTLRQPLPRQWNSFAYVMEGFVTVSGSKGNQTEVPTFHNVIFEQEGDGIVIENSVSSKENARLIMVAGLPLNQKIVQYGPFVMTSMDEVYKAVSDYQSHSNGFERAANWESEIGKRMLQ